MRFLAVAGLQDADQSTGRLAEVGAGAAVAVPLKRTDGAIGTCEGRKGEGRKAKNWLNYS